jgi:microcystin-dependent protein
LGFSFKKFFQGINIVPKTISSSSAMGDLEVLLSDGKLRYNDGTTNTSISTTTSTDTLVNKTIDTASPNIIKINGNTLAAPAGTAILTFPNSTDTIVARNTTDTLTNKTLTGNTAANLINGAGSFVFNSSGVITTPSATDTLVARNTIDTLINKTINGANNTLTIRAASDVTGKLPLINGGTNATLTASNGQVIYSNTIALALTTGGIIGQLLQYNPGASPTWVTAPGTGTVTNITFTGDGTVLSSTPSPAINSFGTLTAQLNTQASNTVLAGPMTGIDAFPTFRKLAPEDGITPVATVSMFAGATAPTGYVLCDGTSYSRIGSMANLFGVIGTLYGSVDGFSFNVPNTQGIFVRGAGAQTVGGIGYNGNLATQQYDQFQDHSHSYVDPSHSHTYVSSQSGTRSGGSLSGGSFFTTSTNSVFTGITIQGANSGRPGVETSPANISLNYIIKI